MRATGKRVVKWCNSKHLVNRAKILTLFPVPNHHHPLSKQDYRILERKPSSPDSQLFKNKEPAILVYQGQVEARDQYTIDAQLLSVE
jgi:hypothetical protein